MYSWGGPHRWRRPETKSWGTVWCRGGGGGGSGWREGEESGLGKVVVLDWDIISRSAHWVTHGNLVWVNVAGVTDIWEALLIWFVSPATVCWLNMSKQDKREGTDSDLSPVPSTDTHSVWKKTNKKNKNTVHFLKCKASLWIESDMLSAHKHIWSESQCDTKRTAEIIKEEKK